MEPQTQMNEYQLTLYNQLMALCDREEVTFTYNDVVCEQGMIHRIFNYRIAEYEDFLLPGALDCRGTTFIVDDRGNAESLVSLPSQKFFNLNENESTIGLDLSKCDLITNKLDGSLIMTRGIGDGGQILVKTKRSLDNDQVRWANDYLKEHHRLSGLIKELMEEDISLSLEFCAPYNQVVVKYDTTDMKILMGRNIKTGEYVDLYSKLAGSTDYSFLVEEIATDDPEQYIKMVPSLTDPKLEGIVARIDNQYIKVKTEDYVIRHKLRDGLASPRTLFVAAVNGLTDDLKAIYFESGEMLQKITEMETFVKDLQQSIIVPAEKFHMDNAQLVRKAYATKGMKELTKAQFVWAMNLYLGRDNDIVQQLLKNPKKFGVCGQFGSEQVDELTA